MTTLKENIDQALAALTPRERRALELRYGLEDGRSRTREEIGREFGVTRERSRQIECKALRKLRHPIYSRKLRDYFNDEKPIEGVTPSDKLLRALFGE